MKSSSLSIIIPVYNEAGLLNKKISWLIKQLNKHYRNYEIIAVENGSTDNSFVLLERLAQKNKQLRVIHLPFPDYGLALMCGFLNASKKVAGNFSMDWIDTQFLLDSQKLLKQYDIVLASKGLKESLDKRPIFRRLPGRLFHYSISFLLNLPLSDTHGIRFFNRQVLGVIKKCKLGSEMFETEFLLRAYQKGYKIKELPVKIKEIRPTRKSIYTRIKKVISEFIKLKFYSLKNN